MIGSLSGQDCTQARDIAVRQTIPALMPPTGISIAQRCHMNEQHMKGTADKLAGKIKEFAGRVTGNKKLETKGKVDQLKGAVHNAVGNARDAGKKAIDSVKNAPSRH